ncbi:MAG: hypothetical protein J6X18_04700 [Bacteroidales bacterium]|nr:hypothetical protein [Bacteroidales bacterium]
MEKQTMYVFTATSTEALGVEDARVFTTEEKAKNFMKELADTIIRSDGGKFTDFSDDYYQILTTTGVSWTAQITETILDE